MPLIIKEQKSWTSEGGRVVGSSAVQWRRRRGIQHGPVEGALWSHPGAIAILDSQTGPYARLKIPKLTLDVL